MGRRWSGSVSFYLIFLEPWSRDWKLRYEVKTVEWKIWLFVENSDEGSLTH